MASTKRPALRKNDRVTLSSHKSVIPPYDGKPYVLHDTVLTVSHLTGTGSQRNPWHVVVTDGTHFWHLEPDDVTPVETREAHSTMKTRSAKHDLDNWLDHHGYHHEHARKAPSHPYATSLRTHARVIESPATGREVFASHERDHHITTHGRQSLERDQFALPPGHEEERRGIKGRLPIDTLKRARNALTRASMMHHQGHITAHELDEARRAVHRAWPSIEVSRAHARKIKSPTGREEFASKERDHHITTHGRQSLGREQFALPPGPEEKRRSIKGRLPIDTLKRARNALTRASMMHHQGHITAHELDEARRAVHRAWPSIGTHTHHAHAHATTRHCYVITVPPTADVGSYKTKHCGSKVEARKHALWDYNKAREHDGLPPVQRLPAGTKVTKDLTKLV